MVYRYPAGNPLHPEALKEKPRAHRVASGEMTTAAFRSFLTETLAACEQVSRNGAVHSCAWTGAISMTSELGKHGRNRTNVWDYASVNSLRGSRREDLDLHPTVKPVALVADAICDVTRQGELVLDIFLGSGASLIAAERVGRAFRGLDIDPAYVDVAITRWEQVTGRSAELVRRADDEVAANETTA